MMTKTVVLVGSLDTKGQEFAFIKELVEQEGLNTLVVDFGVMGQPQFEPDIKRQAIVDSWPGDLDDSAARRDWGWEPIYDVERCFNEYLIPNIRLRYQELET